MGIGGRFEGMIDRTIDRFPIVLWIDAEGTEERCLSVIRLIGLALIDHGFVERGFAQTLARTIRIAALFESARSMKNRQKMSWES